MTAVDIEEKVWFRLLNEWRRRGRRGLTLPFLVGAVLRAKGSPTGTKSDILALLDDIKSQDDDQRIVVFGWCADLQNPLLRLEFAEQRMFLDPFEPIDEFFVIEKLLGTYLQLHDHNKAELLEVLVEYAAQPISEGRYSLVRVAEERKYAPFNQGDLRLIDDALRSS